MPEHYVNPVSESATILIAGPTASGKSALALALAEKLGGVDHQRRFHAGLPRPAHHHGAAVAGGGAPGAAPAVRPPRRGGELFRRALVHGRRRDARSDKTLRPRRDRRRRHRALFQVADARDRRGAAGSGRGARSGAGAARGRRRRRAARRIETARPGRGGPPDARRSFPHHPRARSGAGDRPFAVGMARGKPAGRPRRRRARPKSSSPPSARPCIAASTRGSTP